MAQAKFHQNQKVFVKPLGTWASIHSIIPHWVKGLNEPLKISYDLGLGRSFSEEELEPEKAVSRPGESTESEALENWRIMRGRNRHLCDGGSQHPFPETHPIVLTDEKDWGGWRVPRAEYDRNPERFEFQARLIASAPQLLELAKSLSRLDMVSGGEDVQADVKGVVNRSNALLSHIYETRDSSSVSLSKAV